MSNRCLTAWGGTDTADDRAAVVARRRYGQMAIALEPSAAGVLAPSFGKNLFRRAVHLCLTAGGGADTADDRASAAARRRYVQMAIALEPSTAGLLDQTIRKNVFRGLIQPCLTAGGRTDTVALHTKKEPRHCRGPF